MNIVIAPLRSKVLKKHFLVFLATTFLSFFGQPIYAQVSTYGFSESISTYTPLATPLTAYTAPWDDHVSGSAFVAPFGFNFVYNGVTQTQCFISPNGFISFGVQPTPINYLPLSGATSFTNGGTISALGIDLISGTPTDNIVYQTIGSAPNRVFVVQWTNARRKVATGNFNFQIRLNETTNTVQIVYGICATTDVTVYNAQVGIRGVTNDFLQGEVNNRLQSAANTNFPWSGRTVLGTANSSTVRTSLTEFPNNGLLYTYTPPLACVTPSASPTAFTIGATNVDSTSFTGNSFTAASPAPTNYLILRSTVNTIPTNIDIPNRVYWAVNDVISGIYTVISTSNATSFTQTGLTPNTQYYYWIIPYNAGCLGGPFYRMTSIASATNATCIVAPTAIASSSVDGNSFIADWIGVAGATDYRIDVSTTITFATTLPAYTNFSTGGASNLTLLGLNPLTTYYFRVRAVGLGCGLNSTTGTVTTTCGAFTVPYSQNFDTTPVATVPNCFVITDVNADTNRWQVQNSSASSNPNAIHLRTNMVDDSDDWFILPGIVLSNSVTYRIKFKYSTTNTSFFTENLRIVMGTSQSVPSMNITLFNLTNFNNTVYQTAIVDFTPAVSDVYFIGFQGFSFANQSKILIDDISVIVSPTCFEPTDITVSSVSSTSATISWVASVPVPSNGYEYFISTTNTQPTTFTTPTGSVGAGITTATISGLTPATLYYVWVRGNCGPADKSEWSLLQAFNTDCSVSTLLPVVNGTLCGGGSATLSATASMGSTIEWFSDAAGTTLVGTGPSFVTPTLFSNTTFYARSKSTGGVDTVGPFSPTSQGGTLGIQSNSVRISFSVNNATTFQSIDIYPMVSGQNGVLTIRAISNAVISTYNYTTNTSGGGMPQTIPLGLNLTPGNYFLSFDVMPASGLIINVDNTTYPYASTTASILANDFDNSYFIYAYNWKFSNICRSLLTPVNATITPAPPLSFSSTSTTLCAGETSPLVTVIGYAAYNNFVWTPNTGISGSLAAGFTFTPSVTTTYSLVATQTSGGLCASLITYTVNVNAEPPAITIVPSSATVCQGLVQPLNATLAAATPVVILSENFNGATNNWTTINTSIGGTPAASSWTLRNSPYTPPDGWSTPIASNDASQYYLSDSYAQGFPSSNLTQTYLVSPVINLAGFTSVTLSFWQYLRYIPGNRARVESSIDGGVTWQSPPRLVQTVTQGTPSGFVNTIVNLNGLIGNSNVRLRFYYEATYDYCWAVDNITISGNLALEVTWSPATDLFFDAAATVPYIAGTPTAVAYAKPNATRTYTGTALGANGCFTSNTTTLTVLPSVTPGVLSSSQIICSGFTPNNLVLTGSVGTIIRWEYANNAAFSSGLTTIANTTTTLTSASIGTFSGDRFYRVVLQNGSCPITYSNSVTVSFYATTWNGTAWSNGIPTATTKAIFNGNFNSTGDLQACGVEVLSGAVVFNTNHTLTVQNEVKVTGGSLTFDNNSSLLQINHLDNKGVPFSNTGNITYRRATTPMFRFDYTYWSTPVSPQILLNISPTSPTNLFLQYNAPTNSWQYIVSPGTTTMTPGRGYICRAPLSFPVGAPATPQTHIANFIGVPNNGIISIPITGGASQFNLLGNPYPSALSADAFLLDAANAATLSGTIYLWTHNTPLNAAFLYSGSDYAVYNYLGGTGTSAATNPGLNVSIPNGKIASGQGFFIKGLLNGTATFNNNMRIAGNNDQFFRVSGPTTASVTEPEKHRYWLNITNTQGAFKQALIGYADAATTGIDRLFDGEMVDVGNVISLYSLVENTKLSIQGRPLPFDTTDVIPLGIKSTIAGEFSIALHDFDGLFEFQNIYLEDRVLNVMHNLKNGPYTFSTAIGTFDTRFVLRYLDNQLGVDPVFDDNAVLIYKNNESNFVIHSGVFVMDEVKVFDLRGRLLSNLKDINATQITFDGGEANQMLLVQITTVDGVTVTKKVIR